jgi:predicted ester cyclase
MGNAATGKQVKVRGAAFDVVKGGKITKGRVISDRLGLRQQIGAIPMPSWASQH